MKLKLFEEYNRDTAGLWYHGDWEKLTSFDGRHMDVEDNSRDRNAWGPGIYFTRDKSQAAGYAQDAGTGYLYTCEVDIDPQRLLTDDTRVSRAKVKKFLDMVPDPEMFYNFDESIPIGRVKALNAYCEKDDLHTAFAYAYSDLYQRDSKLFGQNMVKVGYDAILHQVNPEHEPDAMHLIVWNASKIRILKIEKIGR